MNGKLYKTVVAALVLGSSACGNDTPSSGQAGSAASGGSAGQIGGAGGAPPNAGGQNGEGGAGAKGQAGLDGSGGHSSGSGGMLNSGGSAGTDSGPSGSAGSGVGGARPTVEPAAGTTLVKVNPGVPYQTFEGWGTSLCWWANRVGGWSETARNAVVEAVVSPASGLGYNVFRYNIGGGDAPAHDHMDQHRDMPGFEPSAGTWNWEADANQRAITQRIVQRGTDVILEAFSNSPPYWMTKSGCASGSSDGSNNLKDDSYDAFADYLTEVVKHYRDSFGIEFRTLEPLNEPNANWWKSNGSQEGCHFSPSNQETIIKAVATKLTEKGLTKTSVSASDENSMDDAYNNLSKLGATTLSAISQLNTHSYAGSKRKELSALASSKGKRLWQSESGPLNQTLADDAAAALFMAGRIITDLRELKPHAWIDWQVGDPARSWASISLNDSAQSFTPLKRFYMHAGFSRYIRPGAVFVDVDNADMVAAIAPGEGSLTIVVRNGDTSATKRYTFDLTRLPTVGAQAKNYRTSRTEDLAELPDVAIADYALVVTAPPYSVTTLVIAMP